MTEKDLRKLSRGELLQMLITQMEDNKALKEQLEDLQKQQGQRKIMLSNAGSIAEAALKVNGVFEAAEAAAQQYLENIQRVSEEQESVCQKLREEACIKANAIIEDAEKTAETLVADAHNEVASYWEQVSLKVNAILEEQDSLRMLIQSAKGDRR